MENKGPKRIRELISLLDTEPGLRDIDQKMKNRLKNALGLVGKMNELEDESREDDLAGILSPLGRTHSTTVSSVSSSANTSVKASFFKGTPEGNVFKINESKFFEVFLDSSRSLTVWPVKKSLGISSEDLVAEVLKVRGAACCSFEDCPLSDGSLCALGIYLIFDSVSMFGVYLACKGHVPGLVDKTVLRLPSSTPIFILSLKIQSQLAE